MWLVEPFLRCRRPDEEDAHEPHLGVDPVSLLAAQSFIEESKGRCDVESAEPLGPTASALQGARAKAAPPTEVSVPVPQDFVPGSLLKANGPFGVVSVTPPPGVQGGEVLRFRMAPPSQFKITVPPWARGGYKAQFHLDDGEEVSVKVPEGLQPGDTFEVLPPAMMVQLPEGSKPGEKIVFWSDAKGSRCPEGWYRIEVPEGHAPGSVISVRIPALSQVMQDHLLPPAAPAEDPLPRVSLSAVAPEGK